MGGGVDVKDVKDDQTPSAVLPYTEEAGDPYYIGDCYERLPVAQEWEISTTNLPYLAHIKSLANSWKPLRHLADWMEVGTTPLRWKDVQAKPKQREERANRTTVTLLEYFSSGTPERLDIYSASDLKRTLSTTSSNTSAEPTLRLFLVEDLSQQVIESLGSRFDVDPLFFREQIVDYTWFNTRDPWAMAPSLMASMKHRNWFSIRNIRMRYYTSEKSFQEARHQSNRFNVLRRPDNDSNHWQYLDKPDSIVALTRTRTSLWVANDPKNEKVRVAIVLIDPTVPEGTPMWHGSTNWLPPPSFTNRSPPPKTAPDSLFKYIVELTCSYPWFHGLSPHPVIDQQVIAKPALYTVCAEWLVVCDYARARLAQIEWELEKPGVFRSKGDAIDSSLRRLHTWRRIVPMCREMIGETLSQSLPAAARLSSPSDAVDPRLDDLVPDFQRVQDILNELQARVDRLTSVVTAEMSIEDSRRGLQENHNLARLTWLATTFIPLSFVTGFFSMQNDISSMKNTYGWYFLTAVPLTLFVMVLAGAVGQGWFGSFSKNHESKVEKRKRS